jgi:hypothetical protein
MDLGVKIMRPSLCVVLTHSAVVFADRPVLLLYRPLEALLLLLRSLLGFSNSLIMCLALPLSGTLRIPRRALHRGTSLRRRHPSHHDTQ